ncbi:anthranilate phosphoribosyltransferase [Ruficoccus amylovorans]|uniref:Anthranilate phosphoribosyltransferase n=1 Tax=Ruficoccus amylovorans TaxID=1804625 RepID=A0A842H9Y3_9BACT|nr:anthranilate phosphoribosyltransferase [Ruficoccus amylovorans]MBC2593120.1 anthranilate phosphoribosyltransferase [Ruficoccus amylovorans]
MGVCYLAELTDGLRLGKSLDAGQATTAAGLLAEGAGTLDERQEFVVALHEKGETAQEVAAFASVFRELARDPELGPMAQDAVDIVGTGGDKSGTANISSMSAMVVASLGVPVVKHGNRSVTSKCGSADLIADLGFPLEGDNEALRGLFERHNFTFLYAPAFHPAFAHIGPVRKALGAQGKRTIFNILGPLINPSRPPYQVMGVYSREWVEPLADAFRQLGTRRALVVHGQPFEGGVLDEMSCASSNAVAGGGELSGLNELWLPEKFDLTPCAISSLKGGDLARNHEILEELAEGRATNGLVDTVAMNAGAALWVAGRADSPLLGVHQSKQQIMGGGFRKWLERFKEDLG